MSATFGFLASKKSRLLRRHALGATMTEMMVVTGISGIIAMIAAPSMSRVVDSMRLSSASNAFVTSLYHARSEAIKRKSRVVMCKSSDGIACSDVGGWEQGWIVFHDANNNATHESSEHLIRHDVQVAGKLRLSGNQNVSRYVSFTPTGTTKLVGGGFQAGTVTVCRESAESTNARQIILNAIGRPRVDKAAVDSCA
jgi:type IV fimbrial biogenesis protein FimT